MDSIASEKPRIVTTGWVIPAVQLSTTLLILALNTTSALTLLAFVAVWGLTFRHWSLQESVCFLAVCALFSVMDILAVRQRLFTFSRADIGGLPLWEYFMWGFYVLHMLRALRGPAPMPRRRLAVLLAILFAMPFATVSDSSALLITSGSALALALFFFHQAQDIRYAAYAVLVGAAVEYTGVWSGQWAYAGEPTGGVALWFITMWGGIGLFTRRLLLPLVVRPSG